MSRGSVRRSARETKKKSPSGYSVGDLVETVRKGTAVRVLLAQLLTKSSSTRNPRWLIRFVGNEFKDEEVYEHTLMGKVFMPTSKPAVITTARPSRGNSPAASNEAAVLSDSGLSSTGFTYTAAAVGVGGCANYKNAANVSADENGGPSLVNNTSVSAREARSRRRQSMIDDVKVEVVSQQPTKQMSKRKLAGASAQARKSKRQRYDKNCVAIKFLTGTLYLYRGPQRRAEFVRTK